MKIGARRSDFRRMGLVLPHKNCRRKTALRFFGYTGHLSSGCVLFIKEQETTLNLRETIFRVKQGEDNHSYDVGNRPRGQSRPSGTPTDILSLGYLQGSTARPTLH
jgi:hypothetical protein